MAKNLIATAMVSVLSMSCFYSVAEANNNPIVLQRADPWQSQTLFEN